MGSYGRSASISIVRSSPDIAADQIEIGDRVRFGDGVRLRGDRVVVGDDCTIADGVDMLCPGGITLGRCGYIGERVKARCWRFSAGDFLYMENDVLVGSGSAMDGWESQAVLGDAVFVGFGSVLNTARLVCIGDQTGIGARVGIWTHGAYPPVTEGFPCDFARVVIGSKVWLTGASQVLPGVTIESHVVVGMLSLVNRDLPAGCLAGGVPVKVLRADAFPRQSPWLLPSLAAGWERSAHWRGIEAYAKADGEMVWIHEPARLTGFNCMTMEIKPEPLCAPLSAIAEDFRDFVRRRGVRFLTGKPFQSIPHPQLARWEVA